MLHGGRERRALNLASLIPSEVIIDDLKATEKERVLDEIVGALAEAGQVPRDADGAIVKALMNREELGSTGIGKGVAVPHAKHESVEGLVAAFGRSRKGIDFASLDGQPVHLVFLLLSSKDTSGQHLEALATVARIVRNDRFCRFLREAEDADALAELLQEAEAQEDSGL
jgi:PTS system fructose-specific IIA component/PTS system nitrogen regulatory IIA component